MPFQPQRIPKRAVKATCKVVQARSTKSRFEKDGEGDVEGPSSKEREVDRGGDSLKEGGGKAEDDSADEGEGTITKEDLKASLYFQLKTAQINAVV